MLLTWALTVDFTKVSYGFFSDGATYYSLAHSLAEDFDFEYRRDDLVRVWREFPSGPEGIFLKRGRDVDVSIGGGFPFVQVTTRATRTPTRLYYGKSYIFPLFAAPFVYLFGTNGFLVLHARADDADVPRAPTRSWSRAAIPIAGDGLRVRLSLRVRRAGLHGLDDAGLLQRRRS